MKKPTTVLEALVARLREQAERFNPDDKFIHDMKVAIVDHKGNIRGHYDIANVDPEYEKFWSERIRKDLKFILAEQKQPK